MRPEPGFTTVEAAWDFFAETTLKPLGITPRDTQYIEARRAFYHGAGEILRMASMIPIRHPDAAETDAERQKLDTEIHDTILQMAPAKGF